MLKLFELADGEWINLNAIVSIKLDEEYSAYSGRKNYEVFLSNKKIVDIDEKEYKLILRHGGVK